MCAVHELVALYAAVYYPLFFFSLDAFFGASVLVGVTKFLYYVGAATLQGGGCPRPLAAQEHRKAGVIRIC